MASHPVEQWHQFVSSFQGGQGSSDPGDLLAEDVVFHSPVLHTPQQGKALTRLYLAAAIQLLGHSQFRYLDQWLNESGAVLEFSANIDGIHINGVDIIHWNSAGKIDDFKVMIRPRQALVLVQQKMASLVQGRQQ